MRVLPCRPSSWVIVAALVWQVPTGAQESISPRATAAQAPRPMTADDQRAWASIGTVVVASDGSWVGWRTTSEARTSAVTVRRADGTGTHHTFDTGDTTGGGRPPASPSAAPAPAASDLAFSPDARAVAFQVHPSASETDALRKQRKPVAASVAIVRLDSGTRVDYPRIARMAAPARGGAWFALLRAPASPSGPASSRGKASGTDLILHDVTTGADQVIGNVADFAFDKAGTRLAYVVDAEDRLGNGLYVRHLAHGSTAVVASARATFEKPTWSDDGQGLTALRGDEDKTLTEKRYAVIAARLGTDGRFTTTVVDGKTSGFPATLVVSGQRAARWRDDGETLVFGLQTPRLKNADDRGADARDTDAGADGDGPAADPERADLLVWHWKDRRLPTQQQVQSAADRRFSYAAIFHAGPGRVVRLADDQVRDVRVPDRGTHALGVDRAAYELTGSLDGRQYADLVSVDLATGERRALVTRARWFYDVSPDGRQLLYYDDGHFLVADLATASTRPLTRGMATSFIDVRNDRNVAKPPVSPYGWSADSRAVLLDDGYDLWRVPVDGSAVANLTIDGRRTSTRVLRRFALDPDEKGVDLERPVYIERLEEWTKVRSIERIVPGASAPERLLRGEFAVARLMKASAADRYVFTRESHVAPRELHASGATLSGDTRLTDAAADLQSFAWSSGARLIDYKGVKGQRLQGALYLPANHEPGKRYPTIVYIYERLSDGLHTFKTPVAYGFSPAAYLSRGYAVLMPDIAYTINDPGMSAVWCVLPAIDAAVATGVVDPARIGLQGHSWGGYQTSFLVTQTNRFKAAVAGAPLTNLVSMYSLVYKNTGGTNQAIFESSQGRFLGGYWDHMDAYVRNSPVFHAAKVSTPLMILHNDRDSAVDFTQGVEYFNTLRRLRKPVVMLEYVGENHGLVKGPNRFDYAVRMQEFFDHHLLGAPAPAWLQEGVEVLNLDDHLKEPTRRPVKPADKRKPAEGKKAVETTASVGR